MEYFQILCGLAVVILSLYYYFTSTFHYWKDRGIPGPKPAIVSGNFTPVILKTVSITQHLKNLYDAYKHEPVFGIYEGRTPVLVVNDLDLIKDVFIKDFSVFADRGFRIYPKVEPLVEHLFALEPERWRPMRAKLSPIFTSGKMKEMFPLIIECAENLKKYLDNAAENDGILEFREVAAKYTTDVIGSCVFGINMNALSDEESEFRKVGRTIFTPGVRQMLRDVLREFMPPVYNVIGGFLQPPGVDDFFIKVIRDTLKYRRENKVIRPDFINMLMELQDHPEKLENIELTNSLLTAQAFVFFNAGFETTSSTIAHALYELALNQDIQDKLREEIRESFKKHKTLNYDQIKEMSYLNKVFKETLRKYPILPMITRQAMENYSFKGTKISIEKGTKVWVLAYPIQQDPDFYPNPEVFDPERFSDEAVAARHPMTYLAFGDGPRNCIGSRFAYYQGKVGLITILRNHKVEPCEKTVIPFETDPRLFLLTLKGGVNLKISKV